MLTHIFGFFDKKYYGKGIFLIGSVKFPLNCNIMTLVSSALTFAIFATTVVVILTMYNVRA